MALKFNRNFKNGRQSEQFLNDELITLYETLKYLPHHKNDPENEGRMPPDAKLVGALNAQPVDEALNYWDGTRWVPFFKSKFQITDQMLVETCPGDPVVGQLWINNGALYYFDGREWHPVKTVEADDSQWASGAFADFQIVSPLNPVGQYVVPITSQEKGKDAYIFNYTTSFVIEDPTKKMYATDRLFKSGQSEVTIHLNGLLLTFGHDWEEVQPDGSVAVERGTSCKAINFKIALQKNDVVTYHIARQMLPNADPIAHTIAEANEDYHQYFFENEIDYISDNIVVPSTQKWTPDWVSPELEVPEEIVITDDYLSQFTIPNLKTDRVFLDSFYDQSYQRISSVCFQYPTKDVINRIVSGVHLNPGKLTNIRKRLIKVDKINATIAVSPYNTEFYGFRNGEYTGSFLIPSDSQDWGDYVSAGDHIILNYHTNQNYDYILAITYEFTWMKADGSMDKRSPSDLSSSFYLTNLRAPINVHVNGLKLEEASYDINLKDKTFTIKEDASNVTVNAWSPYRKQFGYIRETDLNNRGIIHLREPVNIPLVFVGGTLIHPLYGGLEFSQDKSYIYIPNSGDKNQMLNLQWCVVDLVSEDMDVQYQQYGHVEDSTAYYLSGPNDRFVPPDEMYYDGTLSARPDNRGIYDYVLSSGTLHGVTTKVIHFDTNKSGPNDGIILFVDGLMINRDEIVVDRDEGIIYLDSVDLTEGQEYVLLKDQDGAIYDSSNMLPAFSVGYLSDSLVYLNGKLLAESGCVTSLKNPEEVEKDGVVDQEIKYFITNDQTGEGFWRKYEQYTYSWKNLTNEEVENICRIVDSYENQLTSVKINVSYNKDIDELVVFSFKFANDISGILNMGTASYYKDDEETGYPIFIINGHYGYNQGMLNIYKNGVKLINGVHYEEMPLGTMFRVMIEIEDTDEIQYLIEPVERGYEFGYTKVVLNKEDSIQSNVYKVPEEIDISLYPGRLTVYINGVRIPNTDWTLLSNKTIMLKYFDYKAVGSANNYPTEDFVDEDLRTFTINHEMPDQIMVEIRYDYERKEKTVYLKPGADLNELYVEENDVDGRILESADEVLFYLNGQFTGLSRNRNNDYRLDPYKGCILFQNAEFIEAATKDELKNLFDQNNYIYTAWKIMTGKTAYVPDKKNALTIVWR